MENRTLAGGVYALDHIMSCARKALPAWKAMPVKARLHYLGRLRMLLIRDMDEWIELLKIECGKTPMDALMSDIYTTVDAIAYYEKHASRILRSRRVRTPLVFIGSKSYRTYEPFGVLSVIAPWNFPLQLALIPVISGLAAGNVVLLKPSEKLPQINAKLINTLQEAGFPKGVCSVIQGGRETVEHLIEMRPDKIFFTGGSEAGRNVLQRAAAHFIPCDMELSGKDPMIVCDDASIERAARAAVWGAFLHSGQVCVSVERVYVHASIYDEFVRNVVIQTNSLSQSADEWADVGAMTTEEGWHRVKEQLEDAVLKGASVQAGGLTADAIIPIFPPTVLTGVTNDMQLMKEETFGPLLPIMAFETDEEAIALANQSDYGLSASIFTSNLSRGRSIANRLETGSCAINDVVRHISNMNLPFGGVKQSGFGRTHGPEGLLAFCQSKAIMMKSGRKRSKSIGILISKILLKVLRKVYACFTVEE